MKDTPKSTSTYKQAAVIGGVTMPIAIPTQKPTESQIPVTPKEKK